METLQVLQEEVLLQAEVHLLFEEVLHHQEEVLRLTVIDLVALEIAAQLIEDLLAQAVIAEPQVHQVVVQDHPLQEVVLLHLEVQVQVVLALAEDHHHLRHHLEEEINTIFKRKFQKT